MAVRVTWIRLNKRLVDGATRILGAKSREEAVHTALLGIMALRRFKKLMKKYAGKLEFGAVAGNASISIGKSYVAIYTSAQ